MVDLLRKPTGTSGKVHDITPESAGWGYVGFGLYRLEPGQKVAEVTGDREVILVLVEGHAHVTAAGQDWGVIRAIAFGNPWVKHENILETKGAPRRVRYRNPMSKNFNATTQTQTRFPWGRHG